MILASQKCIFDQKNWLGYKPSKNKKYFKNYFVKETSSFSPSTICNLCGRGGHISDNCPLRKSPHVLYMISLLNKRPSKEIKKFIDK